MCTSTGGPKGLPGIIDILKGEMKMVKVKRERKYLSYIFDDNVSFSMSEYRIMKNRRDSELIPCFHILYNGYTKLLYPVGDYVPLSERAEHWVVGEVILYIRKIVKGLMEIKDYGSLKLETIDVDISHIFLNPSDDMMKLIILPVASGEVFGKGEWNNWLKSTLISIIEISKGSDTIPLKRLKNKLTANNYTLEQLDKVLNEIIGEGQEFFNTEQLRLLEKEARKRLVLISKNTLLKTTILIDKDEFVIGKNPAMSDGVIEGVPTISRKHCKILNTDSGYFVQDLQSVNHTYLNGKEVKKNERQKIIPGDTLRLADMDFLVTYEE